VLQCVVLQCVVVCWSVLECVSDILALCCSVVQRVAVRFNVLQCVVLQCVVVCCSVL